MKIVVFAIAQDSWTSSRNNKFFKSDYLRNYYRKSLSYRWTDVKFEKCDQTMDTMEQHWKLEGLFLLRWPCSSDLIHTNTLLSHLQIKEGSVFSSYSPLSPTAERSWGDTSFGDNLYFFPLVRASELGIIGRTFFPPLSGDLTVMNAQINAIWQKASDLHEKSIKGINESVSENCHFFCPATSHTSGLESNNSPFGKSKRISEHAWCTPMRQRGPSKTRLWLLPMHLQSCTMKKEK